MLSIASLPDLNFFLSRPSWMWDFFRFRFRLFDVELLFASGLFCLGSIWSSRFLWRLVQRTACIWYVRARTSFFMFRLRCRCAWVIIYHTWYQVPGRCYGVYYFLLVIFFLPRYFFHSGVLGACPVTTDCIVLRRWAHVRTTTTTTTTTTKIGIVSCTKRSLYKGNHIECKIYTWYQVYCCTSHKKWQCCFRTTAFDHG